MKKTRITRRLRLSSTAGEPRCNAPHKSRSPSLSCWARAGPRRRGHRLERQGRRDRRRSQARHAAGRSACWPSSRPPSTRPSTPSPSAIPPRALQARRRRPAPRVDAAVAAANRATLAEAHAVAAGGDRQRLPGRAGDDRRRPGEDRRHRRRRAGRGGGPGCRAPTTALDAPDAYRPHTTAGVYVPTATPAVPQWPQRKPWLMTSAAQFRPGPPPALTSEIVGARLQRDQGARRQEQHPPHAPSRPRSRASGTTRCRRSTTASCARSPTCPAARSRRTRACSRR